MRRFRPDIYPAAIVLIGVLTLFINAGEPLVALPRAALVAVLVTLVLQVALTLAARSTAIGAFATLIVILVIPGAWPVAALLAVVPAWWLAVFLVRRQRRLPPPDRRVLRIGRQALNLSAGVLLAVVVANGMLIGAFPTYGPPSVELTSAPAPSQPNIYLVLLDGYPGIDSVRQELGIDNHAFANALASRGFEVATGSRSNYTQTWVTVASLFDMRYVQDEPGLVPVPEDLGEQRRRLDALINGGRAFAELRARGYGIAAGVSAFTSAGILSANQVHDSGQLNEFEELILRKSGLLGLLGGAGRDFVAGQARDRINDSLGWLASAQPPQPSLVFSHVLAPHPPLLYTADGGALPPAACYPRDCPFWLADVHGVAASVAEYGQKLQATLTYLNARVLTAVDAVIGRDPDAVIILFSDHGMRFDASDIPEHFENFFAARTPGHPGTFEASISPVNVFPELLNAYFGASLPVQPYHAWQSGAFPLEMTSVH